MIFFSLKVFMFDYIINYKQIFLINLLGKEYDLFGKIGVNDFIYIHIVL